MEKTNVMRILDLHKLDYIPFFYEKNITDGVSVANALNKNSEMVFKTLVTVGSDKNYYVFLIPVSEKLDMRKAAKAVSVKSVEMIKQKELLPLTGYIHGGCSPIGMKKLFVTTINDTAQLFDSICVSGGKVGCQIEVNPNLLAKFVNAIFFDVVE